MWALSVAFAVTAIACLSAANPNPNPTPLQPGFDANGWTPAPTPAARLLKRQSLDDLQTCGYVDGAASNALTCSVICGYDDYNGWFGCCSSTTVDAGTPVPVRCPVETDCVDYEYMYVCAQDEDCISNAAVLKCSNRESPYCGAFTLVDAGYMYNYFCAEAPELTSVYVYATDTLAFGGGSTLDGDTLPGLLPGTFSLTINTDPSTISSESETTSATRTSNVLGLTTSASSTTSAPTITLVGAVGPSGRPGLIEAVGAVVAVVMNLV